MPQARLLHPVYLLRTTKVLLTVITTNLDLLEGIAGGTSHASRVSLIRNAVAVGLDALESIRMPTGPES